MSNVSNIERKSRTVTFIILSLGLVAFLFPVFWMIGTSLKTPPETMYPLQLLPAKPMWGNFPEALGMINFFNSLANTLVITVCCVIGQIVSCSLVGFGFAKFRFPGRDWLFVAMLATMMLPGQVTMIPVFILFRNMGLVDSLGALIVPSFFGGAFFVYMFRQFFSAVPEEVLEAARVDGASSWGIYWKIMLPMSWPVMMVVMIYTFIGAWNDYMGPLIYLNSKANFTLAQALAGFTGQEGNVNINLQMAAAFVTMLPCLILFFAAQRYFFDSEFSAAVKG